MNQGTIGDMAVLGITESFQVKRQVLLSAAEAAEMILRVDNIIKAAPRSVDTCLSIGLSVQSCLCLKIFLLFCLHCPLSLSNLVVASLLLLCVCLVILMFFPPISSPLQEESSRPPPLLMLQA